MPDGKPVIGFVPDLPNVLIATGHEGSGHALVIPLCKSAPVTGSFVFISFYLVEQLNITHPWSPG